MYKLYNTQEDFASNLNEFLKNSDFSAKMLQKWKTIFSENVT